MTEKKDSEPEQEPVIKPKRGSKKPTGSEAQSDDGGPDLVDSIDDLIEAEGPDVETSGTDASGDASGTDTPDTDSLTQEEISFLEAGERDLVADMRNDLARAQAELVNFRKRVERDRQANREAVIAEVIRTLLPAVDDLDRAEGHGDLAGSPLELVAQKLHGAFARYGLRQVGEKGEAFDPHLHEALVQLPSPDVTVNTVADVIEPGYALGDRLLRAAKVAVSVPDGQ
ncbi:MAG: molecular chaperone GrpE [Actinomycetota bacterium]|jgi:molecular chaperone GrpE|nr:molecular chaperone GrpE [Actinomycetota bacterium]MDQ1542680.1 molecular chaperone GrpE [Actinomycetota bacterium]MDQ1562154.1 molecular chaperone GrpE [Actinomycetota bacterium]MDQ1563773.1 molecular chaperone GrpE [Actinomycetota bacterium]